MENREVRLRYIHYGHTRFDPEFFQTPANLTYWNKPKGGLWASAENALYGWSQWCAENDFCECNLNKSFAFRLKDNARVLRIDNIGDVSRLPVQSGMEELTTLKPIDFEKLMRDGVDAIEFNLSKDYRLYWELYGWDCDCILVLNPNVIEED